MRGGGYCRLIKAYKRRTDVKFYITIQKGVCLLAHYIQSSTAPHSMGRRRPINIHHISFRFLLGLRSPTNFFDYESNFSAGRSQVQSDVFWFFYGNVYHDR